MTPHLSVAVVIPVRNGAGEIGACVEAVRRQTRPADDIVVVDNGSTDSTALEARAAGARVIREPSPGSYVARNAGLAATTADVVAFTDADCVPDPEWLAGLLPGFDDPGVGAIGGSVEPLAVTTVAQRWALERRVLDQEQAFHHPFLPYFATANVAYRREALDAIGGFEPALASGGDVDAAWRLQLLTGYRLSFAPVAVVRHRHRRRVSTLVRQHRRYALGHGRLDGRWSSHPGYRDAAGSPIQRLRAVWLLPLRLPYRAITGGRLSVPLIDAAVRLAHEVGRREGRRQPPLPPLGRPSPAGPKSPVLSSPSNVRNR